MVALTLEYAHSNQQKRHFTQKTLPFFYRGAAANPWGKEGIVNNILRVLGTIWGRKYMTLRHPMPQITPRWNKRYCEQVNPRNTR